MLVTPCDGSAPVNVNGTFVRRDDTVLVYEVRGDNEWVSSQMRKQLEGYEQRKPVTAYAFVVEHDGKPQEAFIKTVQFVDMGEPYTVVELQLVRP